MTTQGNILVIGRRWFDRRYGNTYFSAVAYVCGVEAARNPFKYGYGDYYLQWAADALEAAGYMPGRKHYENGGAEQLREYCRRNDIQLQYTVTDVARKRDL